jgi:hypothetical protein
MTLQLPKVIDLVREGKKVYFVCYKSKELHYRCEDGFEFPVPIEDAGDAEFLPEDSALFFMRWIRVHLKMLEKAQKEQTAE